MADTPRARRGSRLPAPPPVPNNRGKTEEDGDLLVLTEDEAEQAAAAPARAAEEPAQDKRLPSHFALKRDEAETPDPWDSVWQIILERNDGTGKHRRWEHVATLDNESFAEWQTDPPRQMVRRSYGPGEYRFRIRFGGDWLRLDAFPYIGGSRTFYVTQEEEAAPPPPTPTGNNGNGTHVAPPPPPANGGLDLNSLVQTMLKQRDTGSAVPVAAAGMTSEQMATLQTTAQLALKLERQLEKLLDQRAEADKKETDARHAAQLKAVETKAEREKELQQLSTRVDKIAGDFEQLKKKDPVAEIERQVKLAEALGYEKGGNWIGVAEKLVETVAPQWFRGNGQQQQIAGPTPPAGPQQLAGKPPAEWRTAEEGAWLNVGEWAEWLASKIRRKQPTSVDLMIDEAVSRTLNDERGATWLKSASLADLMDLFKMVVPADELRQFPDLQKEGANFIVGFTQRYDETVKVVQDFQAAQAAKKQQAAVAGEGAKAPAARQPITVAGRPVAPLPPPPPPPPPPPAE